MRKLTSLMMMGVVAMGLGVGISGCSEESTAKKETTISTPGGKTTATETVKIKQSGDNPPPVKAP